MDPKYKYGIIHVIIFVYLIIIFIDKNRNYFDDDKRELKNPFNNLFYLLIYLYLWFSIYLGIKFGLDHIWINDITTYNILYSFNLSFR